MTAPADPHEIRDVNTRYHDAAASEYDFKWGIKFDGVGSGQVLGKLTKALGHAPGRYERSLEIGAGTGYFTLNLLREGIVGHATATDISPGMLDTLSANAAALGLTVHTQVADAEALPFEDGSFDLVFGHAVLHHIPDLAAAFGEFHRVLAPGGTLAFAGEPSRCGDRLAAVPKAAARRVAPLWRAAMSAQAAIEPGGGGGGGGGGRDHYHDQGHGHGHGNDHEQDHEHDHDHDHDHEHGHDHDQSLEGVVDVHAFAPATLHDLAVQAGFQDVRVGGEELLANWFGWFNRTLEGSAEPQSVPWLWRQYAFRGYLLLAALDRRLLERRLPASIFYNLLISARRRPAPPSMASETSH